MDYFAQQLINGLVLGSIYGLIAIGYTMVYGIVGMINFAHGDVFMVSTFVALITFLVLTLWLGVGSVALALAAYNAGAGTVDRCGCVPAIPETQAYVARILGLMGGMGGGNAFATQPGQQGLEVHLVS